MADTYDTCLRVFRDRIEVKYYNLPYCYGSRDYDINREDKKKERIEKNIKFSKEYKNLKRAQQNVRDIISANLTLHTKFLTLTCRENILDYSKIKRMFTTFVQAMKREGYILKYLGVLEHQKSRGLKNNDEGAYHIHCVIFNDEYIPFDIINKHWDGFTDIKILNGLRLKDNTKINSVALYVCKYITKENYTEYSRHVYFCSKGLYRPTVVYIDDEDYVMKQGLREGLINYELESTSGYEFNIKLNNSEVKSVLNQKITTKTYKVIK